MCQVYATNLTFPYVHQGPVYHLSITFYTRLELNQAMKRLSEVHDHVPDQEQPFFILELICNRRVYLTRGTSVDFQDFLAFRA